MKLRIIKNRPSTPRTGREVEHSRLAINKAPSQRHVRTPIRASLYPSRYSFTWGLNCIVTVSLCTVSNVPEPLGFTVARVYGHDSRRLYNYPDTKFSRRKPEEQGGVHGGNLRVSGLKNYDEIISPWISVALRVMYLVWLQQPRALFTTQHFLQQLASRYLLRR